VARAKGWLPFEGIPGHMAIPIHFFDPISNFRRPRARLKGHSQYSHPGEGSSFPAQTLRGVTGPFPAQGPKSKLLPTFVE